jgi:hypothetical protein
MDHPLRPAGSFALRTWRARAVAAGGVAAVELVLLVVAGVALLTRGEAHAVAPTHAPAHVAKAKHTAAPRHHRVVAATAAPRAKVGVVVLNGNGRQGAAAAAASRVHRRGYRVRSVGNAARMSYTRSLVMYRPGYESEGRRFAHDLGIRLVGPLDGMRPTQLHGAQLVFILGG